MKPQYVTRLITQYAIGGGDAILSNIVNMEKDRGFIVVRPGEAEWFPAALWKKSSICSIAANRIRIVLVEAKQQKSGAFRLLVDQISDLDLVPVVVEPHDRLAVTLASWGWRHRRHGVGAECENIWYPRSR